jgi:hypothetical protein
MRNSIKQYIIKTKEAYKIGNIREAVKYWNSIYDELGDINSDNFSEWRESMSLFTDDEVFKITDYYKSSVGYNSVSL